MAKQQPKTLDALIFIDTNILLDFYRIRKSDVSLKYLEEIEKHKDSIIISSQVEMEFKKNRQIAILESISEINKISVNLNTPVIFSNDETVEKMKESKKEIDDLQKKLKTQIEDILKNPNKKDPVFIALEKVFNHKSKLNLDRENELRFSIRELANKRFNLGYPPRKKDDTSIGDAVNWEWIINCAENNEKDIIIVTRDTDYGAIYNDDSVLNDWLKQEFLQRIGKKQQIILTDKLSRAFKLVQIPVTKEMIEEEENIISNNYKWIDAIESFKKSAENIKKWQEANEARQKFTYSLKYLNNFNK